MHRASEDHRVDENVSTSISLYFSMMSKVIPKHPNASRVLSETFTTLQRYLSLFHVYACSYTFVYIC